MKEREAYKLSCLIGHSIIFSLELLFESLSNPVHLLSDALGVLGDFFDFNSTLFLHLLDLLCVVNTGLLELLLHTCRGLFDVFVLIPKLLP